MHQPILTDDRLLKFNVHGSCGDPGILILKDLEEYGEKLEAETRTLQEERGRQERLATSITDQMYTEAQVRHGNI